MEPGKKYRIGTGAAILLVLLALFCDVLSLIPFVGTVVGPGFWIIVNLYLLKAGIGIFNGKKLATSAISMLAEIIPAVQALPALTVGIIVIIVMVRVEDKTGVSLSGIAKGNTGGGKMPLNANGSRMPEKVRLEETRVARQQAANIDGIRRPDIEETPS